MSTSRQVAYSEPRTDTARATRAGTPTVRSNVRRCARPTEMRSRRFDRRGHHLRRMLLAVDVLALCAAYVLATVWSPPAAIHVGHFVPRPGLLVAALPVWMLLAYVHG